MPERIQLQLLPQLAGQPTTAPLSRPPDLEGYVRGCRHTADRVGLLCCGSPLVALRALTGQFKREGTSPADEGTRQERVRSSTALREMVAFMLSDEYASLVED